MKREEKNVQRIEQMIIKALETKRDNTNAREAFREKRDERMRREERTRTQKEDLKSFNPIKQEKNKMERKQKRKKKRMTMKKKKRMMKKKKRKKRAISAININRRRTSES